MSVTNRIAKNTAYLYVKMGITIFISLYSTRLILNALGASDFGIYNLVGGAIAMLGVLNTAMAGATQRFMSFHQGKGDKEIQKQIFNISFVLHLLTAIVVGIVLLFLGYFFFNGILNIPEDRMYAAKVVYGSLVVSVMFTMMSVPYDALLNAHENMFYYSVVGILEALLKLSVAVIIVYTSYDKLVLYGILMTVIPLITLTIMRVYSHKNYEECTISIKRYWDKSLMKEMVSFAGWNFFGTAAILLTNHGQGILLNIFFGTKINAAQGVATQISGQLGAFSNNMLKAVNPVIVKNEGAKNKKTVKEVSFTASKVSFGLLALFGIPFVLETPYIFSLWLENIPEYAILFTQLVLIRNLINQMVRPLITSIAATGNIKGYQLSTSLIYGGILLLTYIMFKRGYPPTTIYIIFIGVVFIQSFVITQYYVKKLNGISPIDFFKEVFFRCIVVVLISCSVAIIPHFLLEEGFIRLVVLTMVYGLIFIVSGYFLGLNKKEKIILKKGCSSLKDKIIKMRG